MNGAQALINTLVDGGVDVCFANPGTSEMHFVAALDTVAQMRGVLALFEGVATGAADGYARIADKPAAVLLHLGPGLGNGLANLHNARRARVPMVVVVGDHATYPQKVRRPTGIRYRRACRQRLGLGAPHSCRRRGRDRHGRGDFRLPGRLVHLDADPARRCILVRRCASRHAKACAAGGCRPAAGARGEGGAAIGGADGDHGGRRRHPRPRACRGRTDRRGNRCPAAMRDIPDAAGARRRHPRRRPAGVLRRGRRGPARRRQASGAGGREIAGVLLRLSEHAQRPGTRRL